MSNSIQQIRAIAEQHAYDHITDHGEPDTFVFRLPHLVAFAQAIALNGKGLGEPVAWRTRYRSPEGMIGHYPWSYTDRKPRLTDGSPYEVEHLYTHPQPAE